MNFRTPVGYNPNDLPGQIVDDGAGGRIVDPITGATFLNPNSDPNETGIDALTGEEYPSGTDQGFSTFATDALTVGLYNAQFTAGPFGGAGSQVEEEYNEVPYWRYVQDDSGHVRASWVADSSAPGGSVIRFTVTDGQDGDKAYFEQIVPVSPRAWRTGLPLASCEDSGTALLYIEAQYLTADGSETGDSASAGQWDADTYATKGDAENLVTPIAVPADARYLRYRFGCEVQENDVTDASSFYEVYAGRPRIISTTVHFKGDSISAGGFTGVYPPFEGTNSSANRYTAPFAGWVEAISVRGATLPSGGACSFRVYDERNQIPIGPTAYQGLLYSVTEVATGVFDATDNFFSASTALRVRAYANSDWSTSDSTVSIYVTFALIDWRA